MSRAFAWLSSKEAKLFLAILLIPFTCLILWELCVDFLVIGLGGDGGAPSTESGQFVLANQPETDAEFVSAATGFLEDEFDWKPDNIELFGIDRDVDCAQVNSPDEHEYTLWLRTAHRTSLLVEAAEWALLNFIRDENGLTLQYEVIEYDLSKILPYEGLEMANIKIDSLQALERAESNSGKAFRAAAGDKCAISIELVNEYLNPDYNLNSDYINYWNVIYRHEDDRFCFQINPITGGARELMPQEDRCVFSDS